LKKFHLESEIVKVPGRKLSISDPYWNTDQGDYDCSEVNGGKPEAERNLKVAMIRPER